MRKGVPPALHPAFIPHSSRTSPLLAQDGKAVAHGGGAGGVQPLKDEELFGGRRALAPWVN